MWPLNERNNVIEYKKEYRNTENLPNVVIPIKVPQKYFYLKIIKKSFDNLGVFRTKVTKLNNFSLLNYKSFLRYLLIVP